MKHINLIISFLAVLTFFNCKKDETPDSNPDTTPAFLPVSDPDNTGNWTLRENVSDEFEASELDQDKWHIQGTNGEYISNFNGRPPSQFTTKNAVVEDGKLKIQIRWEPDYPFDPAVHHTTGEKFENITTAAVIGKTHFRYGYMEVKVRSAKAPITSAFWTTSSQAETKKSEMDMFEMFGGHKTSDAWKKRLKFNMISWDPNNPYYLPDGNGPAYTDNIQADFNTADDFHVYGFEWTKDYVKVYIDGELHPDGNITKELVTNDGADPDRWVTDVPYKLWFDSETFPWLGLPKEEDLPADFEIEYVRVWKKG